MRCWSQYSKILSDYCWLSFLRKIRESIDLLVRCSSFRSSCRHSLCYIWQAVLKSDGALNQILSFITGQNIDIAWLGSTTWTIVVVAAIHGWKWMGLSMLIFLAGLKTIDSDVIEAAAIDGANRRQTFWRIKFPLLAPAFTFNVATSLLGSMNGFDIVQATTQGGPGSTTEIINLFIWRTFGQGLYSQSTTMSLVLFIMVMIIAVPLIWYLRRREAKIL